MSMHRLIYEAIAAKIVGVVGSDPKVTTIDEADGNERSWPARLTLPDGIVHGYVIRRRDEDAFRSTSPGTAQHRDIWEVKAYRTKGDTETNLTFYDGIEAIKIAISPEEQLVLSDSKHVKVMRSHWVHSEKSPQEDTVLLYTVGDITIEYTTGC